MAKTAKASASEVRKALAEARKAWGWTPSELIGVLRGGGSSMKGGEYERELCKRLSLWWSHGERDDIFWRSAGSGARAKVRGRSGVNTAGQHGDIAATDPSAAPFIDIFTVEIKRGYSEYTAQDLWDRLAVGGVQVWEGFVQQTIESYMQAGSFAWLMIARRDRREAIVWMPAFALAELRRVGAFAAGPPVPFMRMSVLVRDYGKVSMCGMRLDAFLDGVEQDDILALAEEV